ncbi:MAG: flagellar type III secretion system pore protein FliP [Phycisphaerales bacterium]|jgi:flagellar biosynthetic protein FliP
MSRLLLVILAAWLPAFAAQGRVVGPPVDDAAAPPTISFENALMGPPAPASSLNPLRSMAAAGEAVSPGRGDGLSTALNIMLVLTVISLAPSIILMMTCFARILIVLGILKQALGTSTVPPPQIITALALFATLVVMSPTLDRINDEAVKPWQRGEIRDYDELWSKARQPMRDFMFDQIDASGNWSSVYMILSRRGVDVSEPERLTREDVDMLTLVPAYMLSELKVAFLLGFKVYLPFLVIDMVVSTMLISMGMMMLPPVMVSLPFKILLFVLVDGWTLVVAGLMRSVAQRGDIAAALPSLPWLA